LDVSDLLQVGLRSNVKISLVNVFQPCSGFN